jgi:hypothetical protein
MKPGAELDLKVVEVLFRWIAWMEQRGELTYVVFQKLGDREPYMRTQRWEEAMKRYKQIPFSEINCIKHIVCGVPEFSTTWEGMSLVVEEMQRRGWWLYVDQRNDTEYNVRFWQSSKGIWSEFVLAGPLPYATVLAAIKALQGEQ